MKLKLWQILAWSSKIDFDFSILCRLRKKYFKHCTKIFCKLCKETGWKLRTRSLMPLLAVPHCLRRFGQDLLEIYCCIRRWLHRQTCWCWRQFWCIMDSPQLNHQSCKRYFNYFNSYYKTSIKKFNFLWGFHVEKYLEVCYICGKQDLKL